MLSVANAIIVARGLLWRRRAALTSISPRSWPSKANPAQAQFQRSFTPLSRA